ncbi:MAG TPA: permease-like cell division protein FtsX [Patescibacteria group bacterium]|jgi:cell division transport system permease protein|nr:permease-like cell division protein FtsX [Patescibacteria group bacterium]
MSFAKTAWKNIRRSPYQALAAILIMTLTFLAISFFTFLLVGSSKVINYFESKPQVTAFFKNEAKQSDINQLENQLQATGKIASIKFVSKDEALKIYREQNKNDPLLLDLVTADVLPSSFEISTVKIEDMASISNTLNKSVLVSDVIYQKDVVSTLTSWTGAIRKIGIVLVVLLSLVSIFIMATIIGIKISQKKEDIEIMKLIGATNWYIRWPFLTEGILYGIIGAVVGWTIATIGLLYATPFLESFLKGIPVLPASYLDLLALLGLEIVFAVFLGAISSFLAVLRYSK